MVEYGWFYAEKGHVYLCDERGARTGTSKALRPGESAEQVARRLLKDEVGKKRWSDFSRPFRYPKLVY